MVLIRVKQQTRGTELTDGQWEIGWKIETKFLRPQEATRVKTVCQLNVNHLSVYFLLSVLYDTFLLQLLLHLLLMYPLGLYLCLFMLESYDPSSSALSLSLSLPLYFLLCLPHPRLLSVRDSYFWPGSKSFRPVGACGK